MSEHLLNRHSPLRLAPTLWTKGQCSHANANTDQAAAGPERLSKRSKQFRDLFADAPEIGKKALENALHYAQVPRLRIHHRRWKAPDGLAPVWARYRS